jgi:NADPH2:quinone reductase
MVPAERTVVRAERFGAPEVLEVVREPVPLPAAGEVLVAVEAIGVNFADTMMRRGEYRRDQRLPCIPGFELTGTVAAVGEGVRAESAGARVLGFLEQGGGYADYAIVPADRAYEIPADLPRPVAAALFVHGVTAWYAVHRYGRVREGEWVLVHAAAGGLGGVCSQLALLAGGRVIGTASSAEKRELARANGADVVLAPDPERLREEVRAVTGGRGCDVVLDSVGGPLFEPSLDTLGHRGRYVVAGSSSQEPALVDVRRLMPRGQVIAGFIVRRVIEVEPDEPAATIERLVELIRERRLRLTVTELPLERAADAHRLIEAREHMGKLVLVPDAGGRGTSAP